MTRRMDTDAGAARIYHSGIRVASRDPSPGARDPGPGTRDLGLGTWDLGHECSAGKRRSAAQPTDRQAEERPDRAEEGKDWSDSQEG